MIDVQDLCQEHRCGKSEPRIEKGFEDNHLSFVWLGDDFVFRKSHDDPRTSICSRNFSDGGRRSQGPYALMEPEVPIMATAAVATVVCCWTRWEPTVGPMVSFLVIFRKVWRAREEEARPECKGWKRTSGKGEG
ncbi:hypothetical protein GUJ93_ZPchr0012g22099 [Zizania palustris]|uniref:Uncharacterized protein n=1 Tax=Zizania palustris TaxID=103762 RepID=A0A8J5WP83_ZIZPA|nr:hypothetical protein GUJ93_ZPchr0012g22099 [Zizania palustris]